MQKKDRCTREERALRRAQTLLRLVVLLWIAVILLCLLSPDCFAAEAEAMAAAEEPDVTFFTVIGAAWLTYQGMTLVLKLDEPRKKRRSK
jgi:hypothetical protein